MTQKSEHTGFEKGFRDSFMDFSEPPIRLFGRGLKAPCNAEKNLCFSTACPLQHLCSCLSVLEVGGFSIVTKPNPGNKPSHPMNPRNCRLNLKNNLLIIRSTNKLPKRKPGWRRKELQLQLHLTSSRQKAKKIR